MFSKVLIANRGEIALRVLTTCQRLGLGTVAVYSDADADALHVLKADEAVRLGPAPAKDSYLSIPRLIAAMRSTGADAVHPGYGFLSENADFATAVQQAGGVFVGPSAAALGALGHKLEARRLAAAAGLAPPRGSQAPLPPDDVASWQSQIADADFPIMIKAALGGGGIGMQIVRGREELPKAVDTASGRAMASFGSGEVYWEKYFEQARHVEVQVLLDGSGQGVCLGERECSVQRRHQKIIEESPSPAAFLQGPEGAERRARLFERSLALMRSVGYTGAGTVEFLADPSGEFYFLEVNARIQVEHPVTELVTGLDLVEWQLRIAAGEPLDLVKLSVSPRGHAIEARLYAEDPSKGFMPQPGTISALNWPNTSQRGLRIDAALTVGQNISVHYDPLLAKIACWGETRDEAKRRLQRALGDLTLELTAPRGPRVTNQRYLLEILQHPAFVSGQYSTRLLEGMS